jgi:signal recognition particle subunit SRP54
MGVGEKIDALEEFHPERIAGRILGMGDVVSLVEKAAKQDHRPGRSPEAMAKPRWPRARLILKTCLDQLGQMKKLGGMSGLMGMMPGMGKLKKQMAGANHR